MTSGGVGEGHELFRVECHNFQRAGIGAFRQVVAAFQNGDGVAFQEIDLFRIGKTGGQLAIKGIYILPSVTSRIFCKIPYSTFRKDLPKCGFGIRILLSIYRTHGKDEKDEKTGEKKGGELHGENHCLRNMHFVI